LVTTIRKSELEGEEFRVRGFRSDDLDRVMDINVECLPENYSKFFYRDLYRRFPETFIVAEADGEIQGYIMCRIERGLSKFRGLKTARLCHVVSVATRAPYRRRGLATIVLHTAMENGRKSYDASECYLEVRVSNGPALVLYEKLGFSKVKRKYGYYMDGEDALVMAIPIEESVP
jgi:ribosomal-protein-alanine N-acetyltransferase